MLPLILIAADDPIAIDRVRGILGVRGWTVAPVRSRDEALSFGAGQAPDLVFVEEDLPGAKDLVRTFSRCRGGPGVVLLRRDSATADLSEALNDVDAVLEESYTAEDLIEAVRGRLSKEPSGRDLLEEDRKRVFTTDEIFGDILTELSDVGPGARSTTEFEELFTAAAQEPPELIPWQEAEVSPQSEPTETVIEQPNEAVFEGPPTDSYQVSAEDFEPAEPPQGAERILPVVFGGSGSPEETHLDQDVSKEVEGMLAAVVEQSQAEIEPLRASSPASGHEPAEVDSLLKLVPDDLGRNGVETSPPTGSLVEPKAELLSLSTGQSRRPSAEPRLVFSGSIGGVPLQEGLSVSGRRERSAPGRWASVWKALSDPLDFVGRYRTGRDIGEGDSAHVLGGVTEDE